MMVPGGICLVPGCSSAMILNTTSLAAVQHYTCNS